MNQEKHPIDSLFSSLQNESSEVPGHIWPGVRDSIQNSRRKPALWYWLLPLLLVGILIGGYLYIQKPDVDSGISPQQIAFEEYEAVAKSLPRDEVPFSAREEKPGPESNSINNVATGSSSTPLIQNNNHSTRQASANHPPKANILQITDNQGIKSYKIPETVPTAAAPEMDIPSVGQAAELGALNHLSLLLSPITTPGHTYDDLFKTDIDRDCYSFKALENSLFLDLYVAPEYAFRELSPQTFEANSYIDEREATESFNYAFSAGLRASLVLHSGFAMRAGLNYTQIAEVFDYVNSNSERTIIEVERAPDGTIISTDTITQTGTRVKTTYNRLHLVDLPIAVGYEFGGEKLHFSLTAGAAVNLLFFRKGDILDQNLTPVSISSSNDNGFEAFEETVGISLIGGLGAYYQLGENTWFMFEPEVRYYLNPFTIQSYPIEQRYWNVGAAIGLRIKI